MIADRRWIPIGAGLLMSAAFGALVPLPGLRGPGVVAFLVFFFLASLVYLAIVFWLRQHSAAPWVIWGFAVLLRLILLSTPPTLSDDVYRYSWDGHLGRAGINPYRHAVQSAALEAFDTPLRARVNHPAMASPYLPAAQLFFTVVESLAPQRVPAFQIAAVIFDLTAGGLLMAVLAGLGLERKWVLVYLWHPLVVVEFAHGAHLEALIVMLLLLSFWLRLRAACAGSRSQGWLALSVLLMAAATLTKPLPLVLLPLFFRRWGWRNLLGYLLLCAAPLFFFAAGAGWGLVDTGSGSGVFGALRLYLQTWQYNASLFFGFRTLLASQTWAGAGARLLSGILFAAVLIWTARHAGRLEQQRQDRKLLLRRLIRLAIVPLGAYLMLTTTVHPWYLTMVVPWLALFFAGSLERPALGRIASVWLYLSLAVALSYLTYIDPGNLRDLAAVRWLEYLPFYSGLLLIGAGWRLPALRRRNIA